MFDRYRDDLLKRELSNTENYDKTVLTLSSAALGFSIAIIKDIPASNYYGLLLWAWGILVAVIISSLAAYLVGNKAIDEALNAAREYYIHGNEDAHSSSKVTSWNGINEILNPFTGIGVSISILLLVLFTALNINKGGTMSNDKTSGSDTGNQQVITTRTYISPGTDSEKNSANIPTMEQVPATQSTSGGGNTSKPDK